MASPILKISSLVSNAKRQFPAWRPMLLYTLSVAFGRGLSIFALPFVARFMPPAEYARLDVAASIIEICGIIASFALADLMFRFAASAKTEAEQRRVAGGVLGIGLVCAGVTLLITQLCLPVFASTLALGVHEPVLRAGLAAASCTGLIELPMAWLRMRNQPGLYLAFIAGRSILQMVVMLVVLSQGYGPEGVILSNAAIDGVLTLYLVFRQIRGFGVYLSKDMLRHAVQYSLPIVGGGLAMFGLGTCDRFFLAGVVEAQSLAHYTLAGKLAFATPLLMQPFALWWNPRRIAILNEPDGLERSARFVSAGLVMLVVSAVIVITSGTLFLHFAMPVSYHGAILFLPLLVFLSVLNELCTLFNVGSFSRSHGGEILLVNGLGGIAAVAGYIFLVPQLGIYGAIVATMAGHGLRVLLFLGLGRRNAAIDYPLTGLIIMICSAGLLMYLRPPVEQILWQIIYAGFTVCIIIAEAMFFKFMPRYFERKSR